MTKCTSSDPVFQGPQSRKIHFDFDGGAISSNGGLLLMSQLDRKLGITARIGKVLADFDGRQRGKVLHSALSMTRQLIFGLIAGHEDLNDHSELGKDPLFQTAAGSDEHLAHPSTLCRFENNATPESNVALSKLLVELFVESFVTPPRELILDFYATDGICMKRSTAPEGRWRTASRSSNWTSSPTGQAVTASSPISFDCCCRALPMY